MGQMFKTLKSQRLSHVGVLISFLIPAMIVAAMTLYMTRLTGDLGQASVDHSSDTLFSLFVIITIAMLIRAVASAISVLVLGRFAAKAGYKFRENFIKHFVRKPFSAIDEGNSGETLSIFTTDLPGTVALVANDAIRMIADILTLLLTFGFMLYINWWLTLIFFASFPVLILLQVAIAGPIQKKETAVLEARAKRTAVANDVFQNTSVVVAYSLNDFMTNRYLVETQLEVLATKKRIQSFLILILAGMTASMAPMVIIIAVSAHQVISGNLNLAEWIAFTALAMEAGGWLTMLSQLQNDVKRGEAGALRFDECLSAEIEDVKKGEEASPVKAESGQTICVKNVSFSYTQDASALNNISFDIKKGSKVALVGGSGSGKSTVLKLLLGLYPMQDGQIYINGSDIQNLSLKTLRNLFAYVPQDSFLFPQSIGKNITGEGKVSDIDRLEQACTQAGILDFIKKLPEGFESAMIESAENVSGGQKQRLALARAFYKDAPIILFDEATSALDPSTEAEILESFNSLPKDKTVLMVAHRLKVIDFCDAVIVFKDGAIDAIGTHEQLINSNQTYSGLYSSYKQEVTS